MTFPEKKKGNACLPGVYFTWWIHPEQKLDAGVKIRHHVRQSHAWWLWLPLMEPEDWKQLLNRDKTHWVLIETSITVQNCHRCVDTGRTTLNMLSVLKWTVIRPSKSSTYQREVQITASRFTKGTKTTCKRYLGTSECRRERRAERGKCGSLLTSLIYCDHR